MQLKDVTPIIRAILEERDKIPLMINTERYIPYLTVNINGSFERGGIRKALRVIEQAPVVDAVPVVRCRDCVFFRDKHVLTPDGQRKSYSEMPPEAFGLFAAGGVTATYGINVGSQCLVDCGVGYSDDKTVFRRPDEFCARAIKKMDKEE